MSKAALLHRKAAQQTSSGALRVDGDRSTEPPELSIASIVRAAWLRRTMTALLFVFVIAGALAVFGVRDDTVSASGGGYTLSVDHATVTRPGLETPWTVRVAKAGGFDAPIELRTDAAYFEMFDQNGFSTEPDAVRRDGRYVVMEFEPPAGDELVVSFDARLSPATQTGKSATTAVLVDGSPVVEVKYRTRVMP